MNNLLRKLYWIISSQFGFDPRRGLKSICGIFRYLSDIVRFRKTYIGRMKFLPCLHDWYEEGGSAKSEYFWQDLYVARKIRAANPQKHVDIGSRVDGFVAHVASFREIEVFDIRPITTSIPGVTFKQADLMNSAANIADYCDSLSCLHVLEHFGLGRYGDPIDPKGYEAGIRNMANILCPDGVFYLSVPVGIERVEFNAHRVFDPNSIMNIAADNQLVLREFALFSADRGLMEMAVTHEILSSVGQNRYGLGIFTFIKE